MNPKDFYDENSVEKQSYQQNAELVASITLTDLLPTNHQSRVINPNQNQAGKGIYNSQNRTGYYSSSGQTGVFDSSNTQACAGLASAIQSVIFPSQVDWNKLTLSESVANNLIQQKGVKQPDIDKALSTKQQDVKEFLAQIGFQSKIGKILQRIIVEDNTVVIVTEDNIRSVPLRNAAIKYVGSKLRYICWVEEIEKNGKSLKCYYLVKKPLASEEVGEVWKQDEDQDNPTKITEGITANRVFVSYGSIPDDGSYVNSYGVKYYGLMNQINVTSYHLSKAQSIALKAVMMIDANANIDPETISNLAPGSCIVGNANDISWLKVENKLTDWQWCQQYLETLKQQLSRAFALDVLNYTQFNQPRTATEVALVNQAIDSHVASLAQTVQDTFAVNVVRAVLDILAERDVRNGTGTGNLLYNVTPIVTTGTSAFDSLVQFQKLVQGLAVVGQFDPTLYQRIDSLALLKTYSAATGINTNDFIKEVDPNAPPLQPSLNVTQRVKSPVQNTNIGV